MERQLMTEARLVVFSPLSFLIDHHYGCLLNHPVSSCKKIPLETVDSIIPNAIFFA